MVSEVGIIYGSSIRLRWNIDRFGFEQKRCIMEAVARNKIKDAASFERQLAICKIEVKHYSAT